MINLYFISIKDYKMINRYNERDNYIELTKVNA